MLRRWIVTAAVAVSLGFGGPSSAPAVEFSYPPAGSGTAVTATGGTTASTLSARFGVRKNAKLDFGAKCDGATPDASAINAGLTAVGNAGGGTLELPAGTCIINAGLVVPSNTRLVGQGIGVTIVTTAGSPMTYPAIRMGLYGAPPTTSNYSGVSDLTVDGKGVALGARLSGSIYVGPTSLGNVVTRTEVKNAADNGIETDGVATVISDNVVHANWTNGIYSIGYFDGTTTYRSTDVVIERNYVYSNALAGVPPTSPSWDGIDIDGKTDRATIINNTVTGNDIILYEDSATATPSTGHRIAFNVVISSPENCIDLSGWISDFSVEGNRCSNTTTDGVLLHGPVKRGFIQGNYINSATAHGVHLYAVTGGTNYDGVADDVVIRNNWIRNPSAAGSGLASGIYVTDTATNIVVGPGNTVEGTLHQYAINTASAAATTTITGNLNLAAGTSGTTNVLNSQPIIMQPGTATGSMRLNGIGITATGAMGLAGGQNTTSSSACWAHGLSNICDASFSEAHGALAITRGRIGAFAFASGDFAAAGDAQMSDVVLRGSTSTTATIRLTSSGAAAAASNCFALADSTALNTTHEFLLRDATTGDIAVWRLAGAGIKRGVGVGTTAIAGTTFPSWSQTSASSATAGGWSAPTMTADTTFGCLNVSWVPPGANTDTFHAVDTVRAVETQ